MPTLKYEPSWKQFEDKVHAEDTETQIKATDAFIEERDKELAVSKTARDWEQGRKKEWTDNKPQVVKERQIEEVKRSTLNIKKIKDLGEFHKNIKPAQGYLIVEVEHDEEELTSSGIYIAPNSTREPNTGKVLAVGDAKVSDGMKIWPPCERGSKILFKRMAGADVGIKGADCRLLQFSDVLAEFEE
jgi:co-chaperonin GroES (HSP10)